MGATRYVGQAATARRAAVLPAASFVQELARTWDSAPFYLDASAVPVQSRAIHHPLTDIAAHARAANLSLIPATTLSASIQYQAAVASINAIDHRGVALRVDLQQLVTAASWASALTLPMTATDLVVDFAAKETPKYYRFKLAALVRSYNSTPDGKRHP
jgi:Beta protein